MPVPSPLPSTPLRRGGWSLASPCVALAIACGASPAAAPDPAPASVPAPRPAPAAAPPAPQTAVLPAPAGRLVAIGDLHADLPQALAALRLAGLVDAAGRWSGGGATLVQTGDITDRGPDSKELIELLIRLEGEAAAAGGRVFALLGNHEAMNVLGDLRYVSPLDVEDFGDPAARAAALGPGAPLGEWLRARPAVVQLGDTVFAHGGVSPRWAREGVPAINAQVEAGLRQGTPVDALQDEGPLWLRAYLLADEAQACPALQEALAHLGATRMVVGHTTQRDGRVRARCGGALLGIDTGISAHYGGHLAAVEILGSDARALYASGAEDLPDPPVAAR